MSKAKYVRAVGAAIGAVVVLATSVPSQAARVVSEPNRFVQQAPSVVTAQDRGTRATPVPAVTVVAYGGGAQTNRSGR